MPEIRVAYEPTPDHVEGSRSEARVRRLNIILLAVALAALAVIHGGESAARGARLQPKAQLDVEIAVDGTASMATAIAQAREAAAGITDGVTSLLPDTRFAVVVFRDRGNPAGEYEPLQPFTSDPALVKTALGRVRTAYNPNAGNGPAES